MLDLSNIWPEWKAVELIGEGSYGKVYKCVRKGEYGMGNSVCAVKVISIPANEEELTYIKLNGLSDVGIKSYFSSIVTKCVDEIKLMYLMKGASNIVSVENYKIVERQDKIGWDIYIQMEYLTCFNNLMKDRTFSEGNIKKLALDMLNALEKCSIKKLIHRDIKPANIFLNEYGEFKLGDFGVAKQLEFSKSIASTKTGTPSYMAPEVYWGQKYDFRVDIYSLGMVMYKLLNGNRDPLVDYKEIVTHEMVRDAFERKMQGEKLPAPKYASPEMAKVILKACEFNADDRYSTIKEFSDAVNSLDIKPIPIALSSDDLTVKAENMPEEGNSLPKPFEIDTEVKDSDINTDGKPELPTDIRKKKPFPKRIKIALAVALSIVIVLTSTGLIYILGKSKKEANDFEKTTVLNTEDGTQDQLVPGEDLYLQAEDALLAGDKANAAILFGKAANYNYSDARERSFALWDEVADRKTVSAGGYHTVGLKSDGTVVATGNNNDGQCDVEDWTDIVAVSAGSSHTVGLKSDGMVVAVGAVGGGQCDVDDWEDIVAVLAGSGCTIGIKYDGTVVATGSDEYGEYNVEEWIDIVAVSSGYYHTVGLKTDGTVVAVGYRGNGQCNVDDWTDIVAVSTGDYHTVGLKSDGTVVAVGSSGNGQCDVDGWMNIVAVSASSNHTVGLKADGTVVAVGFNGNQQCDVFEWKDIVAVSSGHYHTVGLKTDGTVIAVGVNDGRCDVDGWTNVKLPHSNETEFFEDIEIVYKDFYTEAEQMLSLGENKKAAILFGKAGDYSDAKERSFALWDEFAVRETLSAGADYTVALNNNGTVVVTEYSENIPNVQGDVYYPYPDNSDEWTDIIAVSAGDRHIVGLKVDGTVVATGDNQHGQCDVDGWTNVIAIAAGGICTIGLKADGTIITAGFRSIENTGDWKDIIAISAYGDYGCLGLTVNGNVVSNSEREEFKDLTDVVAIEAGYTHYVFLKSNGTVVALERYGLDDYCDVSDWTDIVAVSAGKGFIVGLKSDGTVVVTGNNYDDIEQINTAEWTDIVLISAGLFHVVGIKSDGTVVATGYNDFGECDVDGWTDIKIPQ